MSTLSGAIPTPVSPSFASALQLRFHAVTLVVAVVAGLATFVTLAASLSAPAMFLGWIAFSVSGATMRQSVADLASFVLGLAFGIGTALVINLLTPALGAAATPLAVTGVVVLVLSLRTLTPVNNALAYFLGLTSFFYSALPPVGASFAVLATAGVIGASAAALAGLLQSAVERAAPTIGRA